MQRSKSAPTSMNFTRNMYKVLPQKVSNKKKRTPAHPLTIEFSSLILTEIYRNLIEKNYYEL